MENEPDFKTLFGVRKLVIRWETLSEGELKTFLHKPFDEEWISGNQLHNATKLIRTSKQMLPKVAITQSHCYWLQLIFEMVRYV